MIEEKFRELSGRGEKAFLGYIMAGDPSTEDTLEIAQALIKGGVDMLELGLPFSDPVADGPVIQAAGERALSAGMNPDRFFELAKKIDGVPKICMTYYNLVLQRGLESFAADCHDSGISGLIVPDLPPEEAGPLSRACEKNRVDLIYLVAPTTTAERMKKIGEASHGFLYAVSLMGVTGERKELSGYMRPLLGRVRDAGVKVPVAVGFGISRPEHVRHAIAAGADGVIVGSALVRIVDQYSGDREGMLAELESFTRKMKEETHYV